MNKIQNQLNFPAHWNLKLLYQSPDDPQIEKDLKTYEEKRKQFAQKYQDRTDYLQDEEQLLSALREYEQLLEDLNGARPLMYHYYLTSIQSHNSHAQAELNRITTQLTKAHNQLAFFPIKLGKIDETFQHQFLKSEKLARYRYLLQRRFLLAKYDLSEEQEKILNLVSQTGHQMWTKGVEKAIHQKTVNHQGKQIPISQASQLISQLPTQERRQLHTKLLKKASEEVEFAETELNAIITHKHIEDELRGYKQPYQSQILRAENDQETVLELVDLVTKNFDLAHKFYQIKAKLLNLDKLEYADRSAKIDDFNRKYNFKQTYQLVKNSFQKLDPKFSQILESMAQRGQLDIFPRKGKVSGAFCSSSTNNPTFVLLNHTQDFNDVTTLGHEMGHAIHSELSKSQPVIYQSYSTSTAETASTFFEQFVFEALLKDFSTQEKVVALHNKIQDDINTLFRQVALFNFEKELHRKVQKNGYLDAGQIGDLLNRHMQAYLGSIFEIKPLDGKFFIIWPHIRYFFYTYTYAYGHLISHALVDKVKTQPEFISQVKQFLSAGGSDTPQNIFSEIGVDIGQSDFFERGLQQVADDIEKLEKMVRKV